MDSLTLKERLAEGRLVLGTWNHLPLVQVPEIVAAAGFDFIIFDLEHGPHSMGDLPALIAAAEGRGLVPFVRVPGLGQSSVLRALDSGAKGIVVPHVDSLETARRALAAMRYGSGPDARGIATLTRASTFDMQEEEAYLASQNALVVSALLIEDKGGLDALDEIAGLDGLDMILIGIYDLSQSLGFAGRQDDAGFQRLIQDSVRRIRERGVAVSCYAPTVEEAERLFGLGVNVITYCVDGAMLRRAYTAAAEGLAGLR